MFSKSYVKKKYIRSIWHPLLGSDPTIGVYPGKQEQVVVASILFVQRLFEAVHGVRLHGTKKRLLY